MVVIGLGAAADSSAALRMCDNGAAPRRYEDMADRRDDRIVLEVCVASVDDACTAERAGADRLELNVALELGGLTPSCGLLREVKQAVRIPVIAMVRPRGAGFVYSAAERRVLLRDAESLLADEADGLAWGVLQPDRSVDAAAAAALVRLAGARETVFHRAFDLVSDPHRAARQLADWGVTRILTAGQASSALAGCELLARLQREMADRIQVLPAGGIRPDNVVTLVERVGCHQVHGSFRQLAHDRAQPIADSHYGVTDGELVAAARRALDQWTAGR
jgi:copper homeostasis protein